MNTTIKVLEWIAQILLVFTLFLSWTRRKNKKFFSIQLYSNILFCNITYRYISILTRIANNLNTLNPLQ